MSKHTPGPWGLSEMPPMARSEGLYWIYSDGRRIADVFQQGGETEANARLIAAAPLLLETSAELIRVIDALREVNVLGDWPVVREALQGLRAAIAKAEGQQ